MIYKAPPAPWRQWLALLSTLIALILFAPSGATAAATLKATGEAEAAAGSSSRESEHVATVDTKHGLDALDQKQQKPLQPSVIVGSASSQEPIVL
ncbi:hypothetical protein KI688_003005 [Linnemannia hyalina]|uniref:Uncharacterized protein n=1 Tax=Linnemannia hyalina TaxID=64524 RepID=A0A9P7XPD9_9FUNG|nr:hypothetical protein KI688_003005 [Linnemannia hyalina]